MVMMGFAAVFGLMAFVYVQRRRSRKKDAAA